MGSVKYSVLTYIFNNGDILREAPKDDNIEYICVTDNTELKSDTWKIIIDEDLVGKDSEYASFYVRYHPFKYCSSNICMRIDGSIQIKESLVSMFEEFDNSNKDICIMTNSRARSIRQELLHWSFLPTEMKEGQKTLYKELGVDINSEGSIQSPLSITRNNDLCNECDARCWDMLNQISTDKFTARPTQVIMTVAIYLTKGLDIMFVDEYLIQSNAIQWCNHNKNTIRKSLFKLKHKEFFGTPIEIHKFNGIYSVTNELWEKTGERMSTINIFNIIK